MTPFRVVLIASCVIIAALAMLVFSGVLPGFRAKSIGSDGSVIWWGSLGFEQEIHLVEDLNNRYKDQFHIEYVQKDPKTLEAELVDALARGEGPDVVLMPHEETLHQEDKLLILPYQNIPESFIDQTFIPEVALLKRSTGVIGLPLYIDPLVLYYNDAVLASSGVAIPPKTWVEVQSPLSDGLLKKITQIDDRKNILQSTIALGQFNNIEHSKDILSLLIMQAGDSIMAGLPGNLTSGLGNGGVAALNFFIQFSDPTKDQYTWNSALPNSLDQFAASKLAFYLGSASDLPKLRQLNPHLELRVALVPQGDPQFNQTFGRMYVLSITKASLHQRAALAAVQALTAVESVKTISTNTGLPPTRRDLIALGASDSFMSVFYKAALLSKAWFDTNPAASADTFRRMVQSLLSGTEKTSSAIEQASKELITNQ